MLLYLHGFSSTGASSKATQLRELLTPIKVLRPSYPSHRPSEAIPYLECYIYQHFGQQPLKIIGSSLGGFYAQYFASVHKNSKIIMINPALQPQLTLQAFIGSNTNIVSRERFEFSQQDCDTLALYDVNGENLTGRCILLLDESDEVINYQYAAGKYQGIGKVFVFPGGSHGFDHLQESIPIFKNFFSL